ncbi:hypothetical protein HMPREF1565_2792 [Providencia alcalifaciens RIMD 1656011]|nr:hypothetical protein HMPREF1565_2792 [Providencia alcalifaciens RIMD 1656011]EUD08622.1 hypothetical protein HMPREF1564_3262 [Providencia alcalifaciens R90-1475]
MIHLTVIWSSLIPYYSDNLGINSDHCLKITPYQENGCG